LKLAREFFELEEMWRWELGLLHSTAGVDARARGHHTAAATRSAAGAGTSDLELEVWDSTPRAPHAPHVPASLPPHSAWRASLPPPS
jgi:hypothetical protein